MKKHKAQSLVTHLAELKGNPTKKVEKLVSLYSVYATPLSEDNFNKFLWTDNKDFEIHDLGDGKVGVLFYWQQPIMTTPATIGDFIVVANSLGRNLYWHEDIFLRDIAIVAKY